MEKDFLTISETELQHFAKTMKNAAITRADEKLDKVHLVIIIQIIRGGKRN
jgi:hypothetical protein